jgi:hypothetical protein
VGLKGGVVGDLAKQCSGIISDGRCWTRRCSRKGKVQEEDRWWCNQHAPSKVKERRTQSYEAYGRKFKREMAARKLQIKLAAIGNVMCDKTLPFDDRVEAVKPLIEEVHALQQEKLDGS